MKFASEMPFPSLALSVLLATCSLLVGVAVGGYLRWSAPARARATPRYRTAALFGGIFGVGACLLTLIGLSRRGTPVLPGPTLAAVLLGAFLVSALFALGAFGLVGLFRGRKDRDTRLSAPAARRKFSGTPSPRTGGSMGIPAISNRKR